MSGSDIYQLHLNAVSRSFALCISRLDEPLRDWVGLTYLLCRILDTIEDAPWENSSLQLSAFSRFEEFLSKPANKDDFKNWQNSFPQNIPSGEKELLRSAEVLFADFHALKPEIQEPLLQLLNSMLGGMRHYSRRKMDGYLKLQSLQDVNLYCLFVAGVVGEALSQLLLLAGTKMQSKSPTWLVDAHHFGLFLQKVNLLKDQKEDESQGRCLIPDRDLVYQSLESHANATMRYIETIGPELKGYRIFCLWSFFLGLKTLPILKANADKQLKLGRNLTLALFEKLESIANNVSELRKIFNKLMQEAGFEKPSKASVKGQFSSGTAWPEAIQFYQGKLHKEDLQLLNLAGG